MSGCRSILSFAFLIQLFSVSALHGQFVETGQSPGFLLKWGSEGSGEGQFNRPSGMTVDTAGNFYVADTFNNRIQKFDSAGNFLMSWGGGGSGGGRSRTGCGACGLPASRPCR